MNLLNKKDLTTEQLLVVSSELENKRKNKTPAWLLWVFTGGVGGHRYYMGDIGYAVAMTLCNWMTLGLWGLIDAFFINKRLKIKNQEIESKIIEDVKLYSKL